MMRSEHLFILHFKLKKIILKMAFPTLRDFEALVKSH